MVSNPVQDLNRQNNIINMNKTFALVLGYPQAQNSKWKKEIWVEVILHAQIMHN